MMMIPLLPLPKSSWIQKFLKVLLSSPDNLFSCGQQRPILTVHDLVDSLFPPPQVPDGLPEALWCQPKVLLHSYTGLPPHSLLCFLHVLWARWYWRFVILFDLLTKWTSCRTEEDFSHRLLYRGLSPGGHQTECSFRYFSIDFTFQRGPPGYHTYANDVCSVLTGLHQLFQIIYK